MGKDGGLIDDRAGIVPWLAREVLPHEADVRVWLRRSLRVTVDLDDVIQETYCRLSALSSVDHIDNPRAYFFQSARRIVLENVRRARVVSIETVTEIDTLYIDAGEHSPERITAGRRELARVRKLIDALPERCRRIFEMRKIEGLSQKEIARRMGVTENIVENEAVRGLRAILAAYADGGAQSEYGTTNHDRTRKRR